MRETKFDEYDNLFKFTHIPKGIKKFEISYYTMEERVIWNEIRCEFEDLDSTIISKFKGFDFKISDNSIIITNLDNQPLKVVEFVSKLDSIDPLPHETWQFLANMGFELPQIYNPLDKLPDHDQALKVAIQADQKGFRDQFIVLANHYSENDPQNWLRVLKCIPESNPNFTAAQEQVLNYLNDTTIISNTKESLLKRFEVALKLNHPECNNFFSLLCGEPEFTKPVELKSDHIENLIKLSKFIEEKNLEIDTLRKENEILKKNSCKTHHTKHGFEMFKSSR